MKYQERKNIKIHKMTVHEAIDDPKKMGGFLLNSKFCQCEHPKFLCYPEDGVCNCGVHKHHVHCDCGAIMQIG